MLLSSTPLGKIPGGHPQGYPPQGEEEAWGTSKGYPPQGGEEARVKDRRRKAWGTSKGYPPQGGEEARRMEGEERRTR
jgi:hypothetical protein